MPSSRQLISSQVLTSTAASVTFSSIPGTFKDLILKVSVRNDNAATNNNFNLRLNNDSTNLYSYTALRGDGSSAVTFGESNRTSTLIGTINGNTSTSNTFSNVEIYIPSYTASQSKPFAGSFAQENNGTEAYIGGTASLYRSNTAISQITCIPASSANWVSGSSFYLYGLAS